MGWDVQVSKDETQHEQFEERVTDAAHNLAEDLGINDEMADKLFRAGGASIDLVAQMPAEYIAQALEVDEEQAAAILSRAAPAAAEASSSEQDTTEEVADAEAEQQQEPAAESVDSDEDAAEPKAESTEA
jgi:sugar (pentulose or hexulose) kinase